MYKSSWIHLAPRRLLKQSWGDLKNDASLKKVAPAFSPHLSLLASRSVDDLFASSSRPGSSVPRPSTDFLLHQGTLVSPFEKLYPDQQDRTTAIPEGRGPDGPKHRKTPLTAGIETWQRGAPKYSGRKIDLSFVNIKKYEARELAHKKLLGHSFNVEDRLSGLTLDYLRRIHHKLLEPEELGDPASVLLLSEIEGVFTEKRLDLLKRRGFEIEDVVSWGWILSSETADEAVTRMYGLMTLAAKEEGVSSQSDLPFFLFLMILRTSDLSAISVTLLIRTLKLRVSADSDVISSEAPPESFPDSTTAIILLVRLIRHARRVASYLLDPIASLATRLLRLESYGLDRREQAKQSLCHSYNRLLSLLSISTSKYPFRSIPDQQRAQFRLIREMTRFKPPIPVTREGYRALAKVQIAHKKTEPEREWAAAKRLAWPPWKEDKLGISEGVEYSGSRSRASEIFSRQVEAGYQLQDWERQAQIFTGWDTDKSPTIQKRMLLPKAPVVWVQMLFSRKQLMEPLNESKEDASVWAARIGATRTVKEAWACFCAYDVSETSENRTHEPYFAMFQKLSAESHPIDHQGTVVPGDGKEVSVESSSPRDFLYVPVEPPTIRAFYDKMRGDNIKPAGRLLAILLDHAQTWTQGYQYIMDSRFSEVRKDVMLHADKYELSFIRDTLDNTPNYVLASFLSLLQRTMGGPRAAKLKRRPGSSSDSNHPRTGISTGPITLGVYGLELLQAMKAQSPQVYNAVLKACTQRALKSGDRYIILQSFSTVGRVVAMMRALRVETDLATFNTVAAFVDKFQVAKGVFQSSRSLSRTEALKKDAILVKSLFVKAVLLPGMIEGYLKSAEDSSGDWLPHRPDSTILATPSPSDIHLLVRVMGRSGDVNGLLTLLRWMDRFASELAAVRKELANGSKAMRRVLVAVRMALEFGWSDSYASYETVSATASQAHLSEARLLIQKNKEWGSWPSNADVDRYLLGGETEVEEGGHGTNE